jgi:hypothetical protein
MMAAWDASGLFVAAQTVKARHVSSSRPSVHAWRPTE